MYVGLTEEWTSYALISLTNTMFETFLLQVVKQTRLGGLTDGFFALVSGEISSK